MRTQLFARDGSSFRLATEDEIKSAWASITSRRRKVYSGGGVWSRHNDQVNNCRCAACNESRAGRRYRGKLIRGPRGKR